MKKVVFMGTPQFAVPSLQALIDHEKIDLEAVVTQPDRPVGRKRELKPSPIKELALAHDIPVLQPEKIAGSEEMKEILEIEIDLIITAAYGQFLPEALLNHPKFRSINVHASLLPKYRGGAPIHYALLNGDSETGVTIMYMEKKMDAGDMLAQASIPIEADDDTGSLFEKLSYLGRDLLVDTLPELFAGEIKAVPQDESQVTYSPNISRDEEEINWSKSAQSIANLIRALRPAPGAYTYLDGDRFKIWQAEALEEKSAVDPGTIVELADDSMIVAAGDKSQLKLTQVQPAGKAKQAVKDYLNGAGRQLERGQKFGK